VQSEQGGEDQAGGMETKQGEEAWEETAGGMAWWGARAGVKCGPGLAAVSGTQLAGLVNGRGKCEQGQGLLTRPGSGIPSSSKKRTRSGLGPGLALGLASTTTVPIETHPTVVENTQPSCK
jgi:hypothetical protein